MLRRVGGMIGWKLLARNAECVRSRFERSGNDVDMMLHMLLSGHWHSLSGQEPKGRCGCASTSCFSATIPRRGLPGPQTIRRFRNKLV